ncbi:MAG: DUF364 domain-containing protein [Bacteroidales bacterium]|jgi:uncharacterized protein (DUF4213/DUF364 family)|nr:DUF364 domain-containing protein [Bacteroidales bacterium]
MQEPLNYFFEKYGIDLQTIKQIICGKKYVAVCLKNGNIGVCATLGHYVDVAIQDLRFTDISNIQHRIVLNAYFNAAFNYSNTYDNTMDIFNKIDFTVYSKIVMIGYFKSLVKKFEEEKISLTIFDKMVEDEKLTNMSRQRDEISTADAVVLSSTTVFNQTFTGLIEATQDNCDIYTLGPSTIMHPEMFQYRNVKLLFGSVFDPDDINTLKIIENDGGTREFLPFMNKVFLKP